MPRESAKSILAVTTVVVAAAAVVWVIVNWPRWTLVPPIDRDAMISADYGRYPNGYDGIVRLTQYGRPVVSLGDSADHVKYMVGHHCIIREDGIKGPIVTWVQGRFIITVTCNSSRVELIEMYRVPLGIRDRLRDFSGFSGLIHNSTFALSGLERGCLHP